MNSYTNLNFDQTTNQLVKNISFDYTIQGKKGADSIFGKLIISENNNGTGKIELVLSND